MTACFDEGQLRAHLDGELAEFEGAAVAQHLSECPRCRRDFAALSRTAHHAAALLAPPEQPDAHAALARFHSAHGATTAPRRVPGRTTVSQSNRLLRNPLTAVAAVIVVLAGLLALPPVRAAADSLLQIFRVRSVVFVPVNQERVEQLRNLNFDGKTLFAEQPKFEGATEPQTVADAAAASSAVGFAVSSPSALPSTASSTTYQAWGERTGSFTVNVESARELLRLLDVRDVTLPDSLGSQPIVVKVAPVASTSVKGEGYSLTLVEGRSPEVTLPEGVDLEQLGSAALQVLGTAPDQARAMASNIDWSSTLVVPIPADIRQVQQVTVNGVPAMLVSGSDDNGPASNDKALYWQNGDRFYVLQATGLNETELVVAAESVR